MMWPIDDYDIYQAFETSANALCEHCKVTTVENGEVCCPCDFNLGTRQCYRAGDYSELEDSFLNILQHVKEVIYNGNSN